MRRVLISSGVVALALALLPSVASAQTNSPAGNPRTIVQPIRPYLVYGVSTREERSALVAQGFDIGEHAWADHVELFGSRAQALALSVSGYRVIPEKPRVPQQPAGPSPYDFPPGYEDYHNYAEMVADVQAVAAAHPNIA
jgi:carboxypeptidase T